MSTTKKIAYLVTAALMVAGFAAWGYQLKEGLVLTHMRNSYSWGLYVSTLAFFVGNAAGGLVLSSLIYLFGVKKLKPFAKIGALCAFANVTAAMFAILPDIGKPFRIHNMILHPQLLSPLVWDVAVLNLYALISLVYLYLLMLPELTGPFARIAIRVKDPEAFSETWARRLAPFSLVAAVGIHVVTAWVFSTQGSRDWWFSPALAPDFVAVALASGTALVMLAAVLVYGIRDRYRDAYRTLAVFISVSFFIHLFLMYNDMFIHLWYGAEEARATLAITLRQYLPAHLFEVLAPLAAVVALLTARVRESVAAMAASCVLLISGVLVHRFLIMPAAFDRVPLTIAPLGLQNVTWSVPIASGRYTETGDTFVTAWHYFPSAIEITIVLGVVAYMCFLVMAAIDRLPITERNA